MVLQKTKMPVNLISGVDTKSDSKLTAGLLELENAVFSKAGTVDKRSGFTTLGSALTNPKKVFTREDSLYAIAEDSGISKVYQYNENDDNFIPKSVNDTTDEGIYRPYAILNPTTFSSGVLSESSGGTLDGDQCLAGDYIFYTWAIEVAGNVSGGIYKFAVQNKTTKEFIIREGVIAAAGSLSTFRVRCVDTTNNIIVLIYTQTRLLTLFSLPKNTIDNLDHIGIDARDDDFAIGTSATDAENLQFDLTSDGTNVFVFYKDTSNKLQLKSYDEDLTLLDTLEIEASAEAYRALSCNTTTSGGNTKVICAYGTPSTARLELTSVDASAPATLSIDYNVDYSGTSGSSLTNIEIIPDPSDNEIAVIYSEVGPITDPAFGMESKAFNSGTGATLSGNEYAFPDSSIGLASRPFSVGTTIYAALSDNGDNSQTAQIVKAGVEQDNRYTKLATLGVGEISNYGKADTNFLPSVVDLSATEYSILTYEESTTALTPSGFGDRLRWVSLNTGSTGTGRPTKTKSLSLFPQTSPQIFDGEAVTGLGFPISLTPDTVTDTTTGSGTVANGTYLIYTMYEWSDVNGVIHRSTPSSAFSHTKSSGDSLDISTIGDPTAANRSKVGLLAKIFVTEAGAEIPYLQQVVRVSDNGSPDFDVDAIDTTSEILYTTAGELAAVAAPACSYMTSWNNRIWAAGLERENDVWFSKQLNNVYAPEFNESLLLSVREGDGGVVAVEGLDSNLIIFKENDLFITAGEGPNDLGEGLFNDPERISSDVGCSEPRSIVTYPNGLIFKSNKGIYQLSRSLQVDYIGAPVEDFNGETIVSADLVEDRNEVRFATASGNMLVFNYYFQQWSTFTNKDASNAVIWKSDHVYLDASDGKVKKEDSSTYLDDGTFYSMKIKTGWIKMAGVQGFQRVNRIEFLGEYHTPHNFDLTVYNDFESTSSDTKTFDATLHASDVYQHQYHVKVQKSNAIQLEIRDTNTAQTVGIGQSYSLTNITFLIGVKSGLNKLNSDRTY